MNETTTVAPGQCVDLEKSLTQLIYSDLSSKIPAKMSPEQRSQEEKKTADLAKQTAAQFGESCHNSMVGKDIKRETLDCMFKAKTFAIFEGCTR